MGEQLPSWSVQPGTVPAWTRAAPRPAARGIGWLLRPLYHLYEASLARQIATRPMPRHVGRFSTATAGMRHARGCRTFRKPIAGARTSSTRSSNGASRLAIPAVTLWVCSTDNLGRSPEQVAGILAAIEDKMQALATDPHVHAHRIRVRAIGRLVQLPPSTQASIRAAEEATAGYDGLLLSIAVAYGGREEIADAMRTMLSTAAEAC